MADKDLKFSKFAIDAPGIKQQITGVEGTVAKRHKTVRRLGKRVGKVNIAARKEAKQMKQVAKEIRPERLSVHLTPPYFRPCYESPSMWRIATYCLAGLNVYLWLLFIL